MSGHTVGTELSLYCSDCTVSSCTAQCDRCGLKRDKGGAERLHLTSLHNRHTTSAQIGLCLWKRSAEVLFSVVVMLKYLTWGSLLRSYRRWNKHCFWKSWCLFFFIYILFLNTVGYLFMWQKQGCPASVYSKYFICQILAALVTISSVISVVKWICFHCSLNFPSSAFFPQADV